jgi:hypothetical protein
VRKPKPDQVVITHDQLVVQMIETLSEVDRRVDDARRTLGRLLPARQELAATIDDLLIQIGADDDGTKQ